MIMYNYDDLVEIERDESGMISYISAKIIPIDKINDGEYALIYSYVTYSDKFIEYMENSISDFENILPFYKANIIFDNEFIPEQGCLKIKKIISLQTNFF